MGAQMQKIEHSLDEVVLKLLERHKDQPEVVDAVLRKIIGNAGAKAAGSATAEEEELQAALLSSTFTYKEEKCRRGRLAKAAGSAMAEDDELQAALCQSIVTYEEEQQRRRGRREQNGGEGPSGGNSYSGSDSNGYREVIISVLEAVRDLLNGGIS